MHTSLSKRIQKKQGKEPLSINDKIETLCYKSLMIRLGLSDKGGRNYRMTPFVTISSCIMKLMGNNDWEITVSETIDRKPDNDLAVINNYARPCLAT